VEYLMGRLFGVLALNAVALGMMFLAMCVLVAWKMPGVEEQMVRQLMIHSGGEAVSQAEVAQVKADAARYGLGPSLWLALWALFLKASVVSAVTLFISTFASSTLFTIVTGSMVVFIGHFHQLVLDYWKFNEAAGWFGGLIARLLMIFFPNLGLFDILDEVITGTALPVGLALRLTGAGLFYTTLFLLLAQLVFVDKEL